MYVYKYIVYTYPYLAQLFPHDHMTTVTMPSRSPCATFTHMFTFIFTYWLRLNFG